MSWIHEILERNREVAVVGVSSDAHKYGREVFDTLQEKSFTVYAVNPKYEKIGEQTCYARLSDIPNKVSMVVPVVPPGVTQTVVSEAVELGIKTIWMPPGTWDKTALEICRQHGVEEIHDICLVSALRAP
jgi:hypothetical protein